MKKQKRAHKKKRETEQPDRTKKKNGKGNYHSIRKRGIGQNRYSKNADKPKKENSKKEGYDNTTPLPDPLILASIR